MHPMNFFKDTPSIKGGYCFVVMPFASEFDSVFTAIKSALQGEKLNLVCERADEVVRGGQVMKDVLLGLAEAELVIVDLSGKNPNVFYELGIAHTVRPEESILLITQNIEDVPFDVQSYRCIPYAPGPEGLSKLQDTLVGVVEKQIIPNREVFKIPEGQTEKSSMKYRGKDRSFYSFAICKVMVARNSAQFQLDVFRHQSDCPDKLVYSELQPGLALNERVQIPFIPEALKFDGVEDNVAQFCVCEPNPSEAK